AGAFFALGRRKLDPYKLALLIITSLVSFRSIRDAWFVCITAAVIIAWSVRSSEANAEEPALGIGVWQLGRVLAGVVVVPGLIGGDNGFSNRSLQEMVSNSYPVEAAKFVQENHFPGPLY